MVEIQPSLTVALQQFNTHTFTELCMLPCPTQAAGGREGGKTGSAADPDWAVGRAAAARSHPGYGLTAGLHCTAWRLQPQDRPPGLLHFQTGQGTLLVWCVCVCVFLVTCVYVYEGPK